MMYYIRVRDHTCYTHNRSWGDNHDYVSINNTMPISTCCMCQNRVITHRLPTRNFNDAIHVLSQTTHVCLVTTSSPPIVTCARFVRTTRRLFRTKRLLCHVYTMYLQCYLNVCTCMHIVITTHVQCYHVMSMKWNVTSMLPKHMHNVHKTRVEYMHNVVAMLPSHVSWYV